MLTECNGEYLFFGFGTSEGCFLYDFSCKFPAGGGVCKFITFSEASLHKNDDTLPRYLPLIYLLMVTPFLSFSSTMVYSNWGG